MRISGPRINRPEEDLLFHILKPHLFHPAFVILDNSEISTEFDVCVDDVRIPFSQVAVGEGIIVGFCGEVTVLHLDVAARGEGGEGSLKHFLGVREAAQQEAAVD